MGFKVTGHLSLHASSATNNVQTTLEAFGTAYPMTETEFLPSHHIVSKASIRLYNRSKGLGHFSFYLTSCLESPDPARPDCLIFIAVSRLVVGLIKP